MAKSSRSRSKKIAPQDWQPDHVAWFRRDAFTTSELALLAAGIEPDSDIARDLWDIDEFARTHRANVELIEAVQRYHEIYTLIERSLNGGALKPYREYVTSYIPKDAAVIFIIQTGLFCQGFAEQAKLLLDQEIARREGNTGKISAPSESKPLLTRERETVLKLILGMAMRAYNYDPKAARNAATKKIADDLLILGLTIDEDTVRKWLKEAAELLPPAE